MKSWRQASLTQLGSPDGVVRRGRLVRRQCWRSEYDSAEARGCGVDRPGGEALSPG